MLWMTCRLAVVAIVVAVCAVSPSEADESFAEGEVARGEIDSFILTVDADDTKIEITLTWEDTGAALVSDLDLRVVSTGGAVHTPARQHGNNNIEGS